MKQIKKYLKKLIYILLIILLIYNVTIIVKTIINPGETPSFLGTKSYVIVSGSMEPNLEIGDIVLVHETEEKELKVDDVISYRKQQVVITHRIIEIDEENKCYVTKGDNNNTKDLGCVEIDDIEGKVYKVIPKVGKVLLFLQRREVIFFVIIMYYIYFLFHRKK